MEEKTDKLKGVYDRQKPTNIREVLTDDDWTVDEAKYNSQTGKYEFKVTHVDGRKEEIHRNRQYVDILIKELLDAKRKRK